MRPNIAALAAALLLTGCGASSAGTSRVRVGHIEVRSPAFSSGAPIPRIYTCDGADISPPLRWSGVPAAATSLSLLMRDPDAPGGNFIHWRLSHIAASRRGFAAGRVPPGIAHGTNGFGTTGYRGPCPPRGAGPHRYVITLIALRGNQPIAAATLTGIYARR